VDRPVTCRRRVGGPRVDRMMARKRVRPRHSLVAIRSDCVGGLCSPRHLFVLRGSLHFVAGGGWLSRGRRSRSALWCGWQCEMPDLFKRARQFRSHLRQRRSHRRRRSHLRQSRSHRQRRSHLRRQRRSHLRRQRANQSLRRPFLPWCNPRPFPLRRIRGSFRQTPPHPARSQRSKAASPRALRAPSLFQSFPVGRGWRRETP
jgi:hypothetical protein